MYYFGEREIKNSRIAKMEEFRESLSPELQECFDVYIDGIIAEMKSRNSHVQFSRHEAMELVCVCIDRGLMNGIKDNNKIQEIGRNKIDDIS